MTFFELYPKIIETSIGSKRNSFQYDDKNKTAEVFYVLLMFSEVRD